MLFGIYLRKQRMAQNLSRPYFATQVGTTPTHIAELEMSLVKPTDAELRTMAHALHLPAALLLARAGAPAVTPLSFHHRRRSAR